MSETISKRYSVPKGLECKSVTIRELRGGDEIIAALSADQVMSQEAKRSAVIALRHEHREAILLSIVAIDDQPIVGADDPKLLEIRETWGVRIWTVLARYYADMNGIPEDELGKCLKGAQLLTPAPLPQAAATGK
jgi:hypothetical protein